MPDPATEPVYTIGHGTLDVEAFIGLVTAAEMDTIVDIRAFPGSRRHPHFGRSEMERWVGEAGLGYHWIGELGGRRRPVPGSKHVALRNDAFRAYADHMETGEFHRGLEALEELASGASAAVMCSESLWWRCHRRLLADHLVLLEERTVVHLLHDGRSGPHALTEGVRTSGGDLVYDVGATPSLI